MDYTTLNGLPVVAAAVASFGLGYFWYSPLFLGSIWRKQIDISHEKEHENSGITFATCFLLSVIMAFILRAIMPSDTSLTDGIIFGGFIGLGLVATSFGINYLMAKRSFALFIIDVGYQITTLMLMGAILASWP